MNPIFLRESDPNKEGTLSVSKWLKHQVLLDQDEMIALFDALGDFSIYIVSEPLEIHNARVSKSDFLDQWSLYVEELKNGKVAQLPSLRRYFSTIFTACSDSLYAMKVGEKKVLIKSLKPVIQLQYHHFLFSTADKKFYPMVSSKDSITWGIQFSYPQIYQDPKGLQYEKVVDSPDFPNTSLFLRMSRWFRSNTMPTPFIVEDQRRNVPIRIGKKCFPWIHRHPQLSQHGLAVHEY